MNTDRGFNPQIPVAIVYGSKGLPNGKYAAKALPPELNGKRIEIPVIVMPNDDPSTATHHVIVGPDTEDLDD